MQSLPDLAGFGPYLLDFLLKGTVLLGLAWAGSRGLRWLRAPASARRTGWALAFVGLLLLPLGAAILPKIPVVTAVDKLQAMAELQRRPAAPGKTVGPREGLFPKQGAQQSEASPSPVSSSGPQGRKAAPAEADEAPSASKSEEGALPWAALLAGVWALGVLVLLARLLLGAVRAYRLRRESVAAPSQEGLLQSLRQKIGMRRPVEVRVHEEVSVPVCFGAVRPAILLPSDAEEWSEDRRRHVLLHELMHLKKRDVELGLIAQVGRALHWPNPLAWIGWRALRRLREAACDEAVLALGEDPGGYARHLVQSAREAVERRRTPAGALGLARPSRLKRRIGAIVERGAPKRWTTSRKVALGAVSILTIFAVAALRPLPGASYRAPQFGLAGGTTGPSGSSQSEPEAVVTGRLLGADGTPLDMGHVTLKYGPGATLEKPIHSQMKTGQDGRFRLKVPRSGTYMLWLTGAHHRDLSIPLLVRPGTENLRLRARLGTPELVEPIDSVGVARPAALDSKREETLWAKAYQMERQPDGTFSAAVPSPGDTLAYQLLGVQTGWAAPMGAHYPIAGTDADRYALGPRPFWQQGSNNLSVIEAEEERTTVTFDPDALPPSDVSPRIRVSDSVAQRLVDVHLDYRRRDHKARRKTMEERAAGREDYRYDYRRMRAEWRQKMEKENIDLAWAYEAFLYLEEMHPTEADSTLARRVLKEVSPTSPAWSIPAWTSVGAGNLLFHIARLSDKPRQSDAYMERMYRTHPDPRVQLQAVSRAIRRADHILEDTSRVRAHYRWFAQRFGSAESSMAEDIRQEYGPDRTVQVGKSVPTFSLPSMEDSTTTLSDGSLRGRTYLIDVWAVWCAPCVAEMPALHAAYQKFNDKGFTILSISYDRSRKKIKQFRGKKWEMPWKHVYAGFSGRLRQRIDETFGVVGIPHRILVDEDGTIVATDRQIGDLTEKQDRKHFMDLVAKTIGEE